jgi:hypothetical protein
MRQKGEKAIGFGQASPPDDEPTPTELAPNEETLSDHNIPEPPQPYRAMADGLPPVRAEKMMREQLQAPRSKSLAPVLSTLQPDQYELVTVPAMDSMIIEGQPGTGKTIVASHRAAYLVNDQTPPENSLAGDILLVGPTTGYSNHVREIINRLADGSRRIKVRSMLELMQHILGLRQAPGGEASRTWQDVDWKLGRFARLAIMRCKEAKGAIPTTEDVYQYLCKNGVVGQPVERVPSCVEFG